MKIDSNISTVVEDNGFELIDFIKACIQYSDPECHLKIRKYDDRIMVSITPSVPTFRQSIIDNLVYLNKLLKIKIVFSSSLKISKLVSFTLNL